MITKECVSDLFNNYKKGKVTLYNLIETLKFCRYHSYDFNQQLCNKLLPLSYALWDANFKELCEELLKLGVNLNASLDRSTNESPLHQAVQRLDIEKVEFLLSLGANFQCLDHNSYTAPAYAAYFAKDLKKDTRHAGLKMLDAFMDYSPKVLVPDPDKKTNYLATTTLNLAYHHLVREATFYCLSSASVKDLEFLTSLKHFTPQMLSPKGMYELLTKCLDNPDWIPYAAGTFDHCLSKGFDVNTTFYGETLLMYACRFDTTGEFVSMLLKHHSMLNLQSAKGLTAFNLACLNGNHHLIPPLSLAGADPSAGKNCLSIVVEKLTSNPYSYDHIKCLKKLAWCFPDLTLDTAEGKKTVKNCALDLGLLEVL